MKVLIIEDEIPAAEKLERYLHRYDPNMEVMAKLTSVQESVKWLQSSQQAIELIFMDIQLTDGKSFDIFKQTRITKPIIFTTAYDEYAIEAFKVNSIDYLLKPITYEDLRQALTKLADLKGQFNAQLFTEDLSKTLHTLTQPSYKTRFMVKVGEHIKSVPTEHIGMLYAEGRNVYLLTDEGRKFIIDYKLEELEEMLDPKTFFRVNRTFIMNINEIKDVVVYSNSRLRIWPRRDFDKEIIVSREKVAHFKDWFNGM